MKFYPAARPAAFARVPLRRRFAAFTRHIFLRAEAGVAGPADLAAPSQVWIFPRLRFPR